MFTLYAFVLLCDIPLGLAFGPDRLFMTLMATEYFWKAFNDIVQGYNFISLWDGPGPPNVGLNPR